MSEIERKFLVSAVPRVEVGATPIEQGYLAFDESGEVRLRRIGDELLLTAKSGRGEVREEVEVALEPAAFEALWKLTAGRRVRKVRHYVPLGDGHRAEIDVYEGALDGLRTAEIEFGSLAEAERFSPPPWLGAELTGDERYANRALATAGLPDEGARREDGGMETAIGTGSPATNDDAATTGRAYLLTDGEDAATGIRRVVVGRLAKATGRLRGADKEGDGLAEAIHGARKDLKKARAALRLVRGALGKKTYKREARALRDAGMMLSASRDAEVKLGTLDSLVEGGGAPPGATALWREALVADRDRIISADSEGIAAAVAAMEAVAARAPEWEFDQDGWKLLVPGLDTAYREGREAFRSLGEEPTFEAVHELRKRGKDLWYQVRLLREAWPTGLGATAEEIHRFTDLLGDHHDLAVLAIDLAGREEVEPTHRETLRALIELRQTSLLADAIGSGERIYAEKPKAFTRRLRAYWRAWRRG
ncbi:MAG: CHAD domain-containing protein [Actinobacteria bacterium]|nr:CHAD domain-containing protein [Actinomycetota bacterium]